MKATLAELVAEQQGYEGGRQDGLSVATANCPLAANRFLSVAPRRVATGARAAVDHQPAVGHLHLADTC